MVGTEHRSGAGSWLLLCTRDFSERSDRVYRQLVVADAIPNNDGQSPNAAEHVPSVRDWKQRSADRLVDARDDASWRWPWRKRQRAHL
jgi:hypothetical protein